LGNAAVGAPGWLRMHGGGGVRVQRGGAKSVVRGKEAEGVERGGKRE